ncbi:hypothetical protein [[Kitasatospora] papulosa]|uniref:hypothetical protein n=1 Tax=[Kitasatospora] papulosa TaxID=1464011 RepID=UPI0036ACCC00
MASASGRVGQLADKPAPTNWLSRIFRFDPVGLNWPRAVLFLDIALVPLVVFWAIGHEQYLLSALFGLFFAWLDDPGGSFANRASHIAVFTLIGAGLTALGFGIGGYAWGWLVLAAFVVTLVAGLAAAFGVRRFVNAMLLNLWFVITLGLASSLHHHARITSYTWAQVLAWVGGAALWLAATFTARLIRGRGDRPQPRNSPATPHESRSPGPWSCSRSCAPWSPPEPWRSPSVWSSPTATGCRSRPWSR